MSDYHPTSGLDKSGADYTLISSDLDKVAASDDVRYRAKYMWVNGSYVDDRYIDFGFSPGLSSGVTINSATVTFEWRRGSVWIYGARIKVWDHSASAWQIHDFSVPAVNVDQTEVVDVSSYINTVEDVNNLIIRFQARDGSCGNGGYTYHDLIELSVDYCVPECYVNEDCDDDNECTSDECVDNKCIHTNKPLSSQCEADGHFCTVDHCDGEGNCVYWKDYDCSDKDLPEIGTCDNDPDNYHYTWDYAAGFTSVCNEDLDACTEDSYEYTHTCADNDLQDSIPLGGCDAECDEDTDCICPSDGCVGPDYYDYPDYGDCLGDCTCDVRTDDCNPCHPTIYENDERCPSCGNGVLDSGEECDDGNNIDGDGCSADCKLEPPECVDADYEYDVDMWVVGENCHSSGRISDSTSIDVPIAARYAVQGQVWRGKPGQCQTNEDFYLEINGGYGPETEDDADPCAITVRIDDLGEFSFNSGLNDVIMHTASQCPPDTHANSVSLKKICLYYIEECGNGILDPGEDCEEDSDCPCPEDECVGPDYYDYPDYGECLGDCTCDVRTKCPCYPTVYEDDPRCECVPEEEVCDGVDNDCDGLIDEDEGKTIYDKTKCIDTNYNSGTKLSDWVTFVSSKDAGHSTYDAGICGANGWYYVGKIGGELRLKTPSLPEGGQYLLSLQYRIGSPSQLKEDFKIVCGDKEYEFIDNETLPYEFVWSDYVVCDFSAGENQFKLIGIGDNSVHFEYFKLKKYGSICVTTTSTTITTTTTTTPSGNGGGGISGGGLVGGFSMRNCVINGICEEWETPEKCPSDCKVTTTTLPVVTTTMPSAVCGNDECEEGEDFSNCPEDCPEVPETTTTLPSISLTGIPTAMMAAVAGNLNLLILLLILMSLGLGIARFKILKV